LFVECAANSAVIRIEAMEETGVTIAVPNANKARRRIGAVGAKVLFIQGFLFT
jgi:hypothetical protein